MIQTFKDNYHAPFDNVFKEKLADYTDTIDDLI